MSHKHERQKSKTNLTKIAINFLSIKCKCHISKTLMSKQTQTQSSPFFSNQRTAKATCCRNLTLGKEKYNPYIRANIQKYGIFSNTASQFTFKVELTGKHRQCSRSSKGWNISRRMTRSHRCTRCSHSSISQSRWWSRWETRRRNGGVPELIDPVPTEALVIKSVSFIAARSRKN